MEGSEGSNTSSTEATGKIVNGEWVDNALESSGQGATKSAPAKKADPSTVQGAARAIEDEINGGGEETEPDESEQSEQVEETEETEPELFDPKTYKDTIIYKGEELEIDLPTMKKLAQEGVQKAVALEQANILKQTVTQYDQLFENLAKDPKNVLQFAEKYWGMNLVDYVKEALFEEISLNSLEPKDRELHDMKKRLEAFERQEREKETMTKKQREEEEANKFKGHIQKEVLDYFGQLPSKPTPRVMSQTFGVLIQQLQNSGDLIPIAKAHKMAEALINGQKQQDLTGLTAEELEQLSPALYKKIQAHAIAKARGQNRASTPPPRRSDNGAPQQPQTNKKQTIDDWFERTAKTLK